MSAPAVLLLDLDGVLRRFDPAEGRRIERTYGLPAGSLPAAAFDPRFAHPAVRGEISRATWVVRAGAHLGCVPAMAAFLALRGEVVPAVRALVHEVRATGLPVGLLSNATDTLPEELVHLGLAGELDRVFCSAELGLIKPEAGLFTTVGARLGCPPGAIHFVDDQAANVAAAQAAGWSAHHFLDAARLRAWLGVAGVLRPPGRGTR